MSTNKQKREWLPAWNMPAEPKKAVPWLVQWVLKVLARYFWLPLAIVVIYQIYVNASAAGIGNGLLNGIGTMVTGVLIWGLLYLLLFAINIWSGVSKVMSDVQRMQEQQQQFLRSTYDPFEEASQFRTTRSGADESKVVEGTIIELDDERQKRRKEL